MGVTLKDGNKRIYNVTQQGSDWIVRDEKGVEIGMNAKDKDDAHTKEEKHAAKIAKALVWGQVNQKDMSKPYKVQFGSRAELFDPKNRTFKEVKPKEEKKTSTPNQTREDSQNGLAQTLEQREAERAQKRWQRLYEQVVEQLRKNGIVVHNKAEMDAFLKEHGVDDI